MFGNLEEHQEKMAARLAEIHLSSESGEGAVRIEANAAGVVKNIIIQDELIAAGDKEQIEDLLITAVNRIFGLIKETESKEANAMLKDMIPPGMEGMLGGML